PLLSASARIMHSFGWRRGVLPSVPARRMLPGMKEKRQLWLPILLMLVFALTRWPGLLPWNFSAAYALSFCAGIFFPRRLAWWLPLTTLLLSDVLINCYYQFVQHIDAFRWTQLINYGAYAL